MDNANIHNKYYIKIDSNIVVGGRDNDEGWQGSKLYFLCTSQKFKLCNSRKNYKEKIDYDGGSKYSCISFQDTSYFFILPPFL